MKLSILDQSPVIHGYGAADAVAATIELAQAADALGYTRYWCAEHHGLHGVCNPCPEVMLARLGSVTRSIRLGSGGVMLPYYSAFKVLEQFMMLEAMFPGRIDLGVGRAPGGDGRTARVVSHGRYDPDAFPHQVADLVALASGRLPQGHPAAGVLLQPAVPTRPELWMLGSSDFGGSLAAQLGMRFAFAHFISAHGGDEVSRAYRARYQPSTREPRPVSAVCAFVVCAKTHDEAERLARAIDLRRLHMARGLDRPVPSLAEAEAYPYTEADRALIRRERARLVHGDPAEVRDQLLALRAAFDADELIVLTITSDYETRRTSYRLVAEAFDGAMSPWPT